MKTRIVLLSIGFLLLNFFLMSGSVSANTSSDSRNSITVYTSPDLFNLTSVWATQFESVSKNSKLNVVKAVNMPEHLEDGIGFFEDVKEFRAGNPDAWILVVGHDVIVPVMNSRNPLLAQIYSKGISASALAKISGIKEQTSWKQLADFSPEFSTVPLHIYVMDDPDVVSGMNNFLKTSAGFSLATKVSNRSEMISAIQNDPGALGFCKLTQISGKNSEELAENVKLVPIDKNGNGRIDFIEDIYSSMSSFSRGVWLGKYPKALSGNIYAVSASKPEAEPQLAFLKWVLTEGQPAVSLNGYSELAYNESLSQLNKIALADEIQDASTDSSKTWIKLILWGLLAFAVISFVLDRIFRRKPVIANKIPKSEFLQAFDENSVVIPKGIFFDQTHTWAFMKKNGKVMVGIDDFLQHVTGPISRIEMKNPGDKISKGELLFTIVQVGKQLSIYSPISGTIEVCNNSLHSEPKLINAAPYTNGWIYQVEPLNWFLEVQYLFIAEKYKAWLTNEFVRLKDFLSKAIRVTSPEFGKVVMQDGGALRDCVLSGLGPEIWDDFQTDFIDCNSAKNNISQ